MDDIARGLDSSRARLPVFLVIDMEIPVECIGINIMVDQIESWKKAHSE